MLFWEYLWLEKMVSWVYHQKAKFKKIQFFKMSTFHKSAALIVEGEKCCLTSAASLFSVDALMQFSSGPKFDA